MKYAIYAGYRYDDGPMSIVGTFDTKEGAEQVAKELEYYAKSFYFEANVYIPPPHNKGFEELKDNYW